MKIYKHWFSIMRMKWPIVIIGIWKKRTFAPFMFDTSEIKKIMLDRNDCREDTI